MGSNSGRLLLNWDDSPTMMLIKSAAYASYYGLGISNQVDLRDAVKDAFSELVWDVLGVECDWLGIQNNLKQRLGIVISPNRLYGRAVETVRRLERTPYHLPVVDWYLHKYGVNADDKADWDDPRHLKYRKAQNSVMLLPDQICLPSRWIQVGPDVLLEEGQRDGKERFTDGQLLSAIAKYGYYCWWCGSPFSQETNRPVGDHFYPREKGGRTVVANCVPSCVDCNSKKSCQWPDVFYRVKVSNRRRGRLL